MTCLQSRFPPPRRSDVNSTRGQVYLREGRDQPFSTGSSIRPSWASQPTPPRTAERAAARAIGFSFAAPALPSYDPPPRCPARVGREPLSQSWHGLPARVCEQRHGLVARATGNGRTLGAPPVRGEKSPCRPL